MVLHVSRSGNQPFVMKGKINEESFTAIINSGSLITASTQADLRGIPKTDVVFTDQCRDVKNMSITTINC